VVVVDLKSFTDFFLISYAKKAYSVYFYGGYRSMFADMAALVNNVPHQLIELPPFE
jgi:delta-aminolevulinic acid dehydratase/porphobilinogen synthase